MVQHCGNLVKTLLLIAESCSLELMVYSEKSLGVLREIGFFLYQESLGLLYCLLCSLLQSWCELFILIVIIVLNMIDWFYCWITGFMLVLRTWHVLRIDFELTVVYLNYKLTLIWLVTWQCNFCLIVLYYLKCMIYVMSLAKHTVVESWST